MRNMSSLIEEIAEKNGMHLRPLIDLPPEEESRFHPNTFMSRKFLEHFHGLIKKELRPYVLSPPPNVAGYESNGYYRRAVTWAMVMERRRQRQAERLRQIRSDYDVTYRRPLYAWVFWCPGINNFIFRGWWIDLVGRDIDFSCKYFEGTKMCSKLMELFPLVEPTLVGQPDIEKWKAEFVKRYKKGCWCGKPQGKAPIWAEVKGNSIVRILGRAEWPEANR